MLMKIIVIVSILYLTYSFFTAIKEMIALLKYSKDDGEKLYKTSCLKEGSDISPLNDAHASAHIGLLMVFILKVFLLIYFMINFFGFNYFFDKILIKENGWVYVLITAYGITSLSRHLFKERTGKSHYLDIKKESGIQKICDTFKSVFIQHKDIK